MSTPIFDALLAESDDTTRALVWDAVSNPAFDIARFMDEMNRLGRAYAQVAVEPEPEWHKKARFAEGCGWCARKKARQVSEPAPGPAPGPELQHPGTWLPGDRTKGFFAWVRAEDRWRGPSDADDSTMDQWHRDGQVTITHLVQRTNGGN